MFQSIVEAALFHGRHDPDSIAAGCGDEWIRYGQLSGKIKSVARHLTAMGVKRGDRVLIEGASSLPYLICYLAVHLAGAIAVPFSKKSKSSDLEYLIRLTEAKILFADSRYEIIDLAVREFSELMTETTREEEAPVLPNRDDLADILFTSGTTSEAKGIMMTHGNLLAGAQNVVSGANLTSADRELVTSPCNHAFALGSIRALLLAGGSVVFLGEDTFSVSSIHKNLKKFTCTGISAVPSAIRILQLQSKGKLDLLLGNLRYVASGTAPVDAEFKRELLTLLPDCQIYISYGLTESPRTVYLDGRKHQDKLDSIGLPVPNAVFKIVDEKGREINSSKNHLGRLSARGPMNMPGYWKNDEQTGKVICGEWFISGDIGYMDEDGFLYLAGRETDFINIGGRKVSPNEIEQCFLGWKEILECACIGVEDPKGILGEAPVAFLSLKNGGNVLSDEFHTYVERNLDRDKIPIQYLTVGSLPRNDLGKLDRKKLREMWTHSKNT